MAFHTLLHSRPLAYPYEYHAHKSAKAYYGGRIQQYLLTCAPTQDIIYQANTLGTEMFTRGGLFMK